MIDPKLRIYRIKLLEDAIADSWNRVTGSTSKYHLEEQAEKRKNWKAELIELKRLEAEEKESK